jgi:hypothetical protein
LLIFKSKALKSSFPGKPSTPKDSFFTGQGKRRFLWFVQNIKFLTPVYKFKSEAFKPSLTFWVKTLTVLSNKNLINLTYLYYVNKFLKN